MRHTGSDRSKQKKKSYYILCSRYNLHELFRVEVLLSQPIDHVLPTPLCVHRRRCAQLAGRLRVFRGRQQRDGQQEARRLLEHHQSDVSHESIV